MKVDEITLSKGNHPNDLYELELWNVVDRSVNEMIAKGNLDCVLSALLKELFTLQNDWGCFVSLHPIRLEDDRYQFGINNTRLSVIAEIRRVK